MTIFQRALDQRMTRLEQLLHILHEDVADSLLNSRSLLSRTRGECTSLITLPHRC